MQHSEQSWIEIGYVARAHGLKGEVYVRLFSPAGPWTKDWSELMLRPKGAVGQGLWRALEIEHKKAFQDGFLIRLKGIEDRTLAESLLGKTVVAPKDWFVSPPGEVPYLAEIWGFQVRDVNGRDLGRITGFSSNGVQDLLAIASEDGSAFEMPFVDAFVAQMDMSGRCLTVDLPEGLVEINRAF